jgi:phytoene dehydrogenase-like protein
MSQIFDVVIVGGGVAGVRAAQAAAKAGLSYKVVEANDYLGTFLSISKSQFGVICFFHFFPIVIRFFLIPCSFLLFFHFECLL